MSTIALILSPYDIVTHKSLSTLSASRRMTRHHLPESEYPSQASRDGGCLRYANAID